jgi:dTDP-4-amino-4,6-dideoxygalactose transaminase
VNVERGVNSRLDPIQAAVLDVKLTHLNEWNSRRTEIAHRYLDAFAHTSLILPTVPEWAEPVWHLFVVRASARDVLQQQLAEAGVQTSIQYPVPPHLQRAYADLGHVSGAFPLSEKLADEVLSLPIGPHLTDQQVDVVIATVRELA